MEKVYDFDELHPIYKKFVIAVLALFTVIALILVFCVEPYLLAIAVFLVLAFLLFRNIMNLGKHKRIVFRDSGLEISWPLVIGSVYTTVETGQIEKVHFRRRQQGRYGKHIVEIHKQNGVIALNATMHQSIEMEKYFIEFCNAHNISFSNDV